LPNVSTSAPSWEATLRPEVSQIQEKRIVRSCMETNTNFVQLPLQPACRGHADHSDIGSFTALGSPHLESWQPY
jgi:hypothetical protein